MIIACSLCAVDVQPADRAEDPRLHRAAGGHGGGGDGGQLHLPPVLELLPCGRQLQHLRRALPHRRNDSAPRTVT